MVVAAPELSVAPPATSLWRTVAALALLWGTLLVCGLGAGTGPAAFLPVPVELPALILLLSLPPRAARLLRPLLVLLMMAALVLAGADLVMRNLLDRGFNPASDLPLIRNLLDLLAESFGRLPVAAVLVAAVLLVPALAAALWRATGTISGLAPTLRARLGLMTVLILSATTGGAGASGFLLDKGVETARTFAELRLFRQAARLDPWRATPPDLARLDRDVVIVFVESYGRTSFDTDFYAAAHLPILRAAQSRLQAEGLAMRSGFVTSPTHGGQSWLAHATLANGLRIDDQTRYRAALASGRQSLFHLARRAGFRTATVAPGITRPWPEAAGMGFDRVLTAPDLGYAGKPFNWVTMPDQFTLAAFDRLTAGTADDPRPLFAQVVLISSHAPWVPVPQMIGWDQLGDGHAFDRMATQGDPPEVVWRDPSRVAAQYRDAISYSLATVLDYARLHAANPPLLIVLGDHQAATAIGQDARREVPVHVIGPAPLVDRVADWGLSPGLVPPPASPAIPMEDLRDLFLRSFSANQDRPS